MAKFFYIARDSKGNRVSDAEEAASADELIGRLQARNLTVINVASPQQDKPSAGRSPEPAGQARLRYKHYGISGDDLVIFCRQLSTLLTSGVTILKSLDIISKQTTSRKFYTVIKDLQANMEAGLTFHETLARHPKVFSELWINLTESGEASGNLSGVLTRLAEYLERRAAFKRKIISALIYPAILMLAGIGALLFLTVKIIPTFAQLFEGFNVKLPALTQALIAVSYFIRSYLLIIIGLLIAGFFIVKKYVSTTEGRINWEQFQFKLPVFGEFFRSLIVERFASDMSTLIESGVPLLYSLEISQHSVSNAVMAAIINHIKEDVREGRPLSYTLEKSGFFEPMVTQMIAVGEEVGDLPQMFKRINEFYQEYTETFLTRFTAMFEPLMLVFIGLVIGIMVIGMFLPIFQISQIGSGGGGGM